MTTDHMTIFERGSRFKKLLAISATALVATVAFAMPAKADLTAAGAIDPVTKYPSYFQDANGLQLEICRSGPNCSVPADFTPPDGESFYFMGSSELDADAPGTLDDGTWTLELATEAAYAGPGDGQEIVFNRFLLLAPNVLSGTYRVTSPYGVKEMTFNGRKRAVEDIGCDVPPCGDFAGALNGSIGPNFITWDTFGTTGPDAPAPGFIGDSLTPHAITGSTFDADEATPGVQPANFFKLEKLDGPNGNVVRDLGTQTLFTIQGKVHGVTAFANPAGGTYNADKSVSLTPSVAGAQVRYTTDGSEPGATTGTVFDPASPIDINDGNPAGPGQQTTTLKFVAIDPATGNASPVKTEVYTIDTLAPATPGAPDLDAASDSGSSPTDNITNDTTPTFSGSAEAGSTVELFKGATRLGSATASAGGSYSVSVNSPLASGNHSVTVKATDAAGNASAESAPLAVNIDTVAQKTSANPKGGLYNAAKSVSLSSEAGAKIYFTTNATTPDPNDPNDLYSGPISINTKTTLKSLAVDVAGNTSQVATESYTFDTAAPRVSSRSPLTNATGVAPSSNVRVTFNEAVKNVSGATFKLKQGTTVVPAVVSYNATTRTATLNPNANLASGKKYTVTLGAGIKDGVGNSLAPTSWSFTTR